MISYRVLSTWSDMEGLEQYLPLPCPPMSIVNVTWIGETCTEQFRVDTTAEQIVFFFWNVSCCSGWCHVSSFLFEYILWGVAFRVAASMDSDPVVGALLSEGLPEELIVTGLGDQCGVSAAETHITCFSVRCWLEEGLNWLLCFGLSLQAALLRSLAMESLAQMLLQNGLQ